MVSHHLAIFTALQDETKKVFTRGSCDLLTTVMLGIEGVGVRHGRLDSYGRLGSSVTLAGGKRGSQGG